MKIYQKIMITALFICMSGMFIPIEETVFAEKIITEFTASQNLTYQKDIYFLGDCKIER